MHIIYAIYIYSHVELKYAYTYKKKWQTQTDLIRLYIIFHFRVGSSNTLSSFSN